MFKKQKSKILVFLLILGILYGCKRQILDPLNPQKNLPQKAQFDKVKGFYENGRYKNQPKRSSGNGNERMTAQDSARFKDFEPEWDKTEVEILPNNEKMLIVPVVRFLSVTYNENLGFIRRLCIRVDANDDFLEANIVELVGNLTFVKENHNAIFKNYKNANITGFTGVISIYELDYTVTIRKAYSLSNFTKNVVTEDVHVDNFSTDLVSVTPCVLIIYGYPDANGNGGATVIIDFCDGPITTTVVGGGGSGVGTGTTGTTGTTGNTGSSGVYIPYIQPTTPRPPKRYELPPVVVVVTPTVPRPPVDPGVSWAYTLYGDTQATPKEEALLKSLDSLSAGLNAAAKPGEMSTENKLKVAKTLRKLRESSPYYEKMYQALRAEAQKTGPNQNRSLFFKLNNSMREKGAFSFDLSNQKGIVELQEGELTNVSTVAEELLHAYQYFVAYKVALLTADLISLDTEFEVKFIMHAIRALGSKKAPRAGSFFQLDVVNELLPDSDKYGSGRGDEEVEGWIKFIRPFPVGAFTQDQWRKYEFYRGKFKKMQEHLYDFSIPPTSTFQNQTKASFLLLNP